MPGSTPGLAADLAKKLPRDPSIPAVLIGWLGRDTSLRGQHVGSTLLADAITRLGAAPIGVHALCADAIDDAATAFYREHQFQPFVSRPNTPRPADEDRGGLFEKT